jgi:hypothetical protein
LILYWLFEDDPGSSYIKNEEKPEGIEPSRSRREVFEGGQVLTVNYF